MTETTLFAIFRDEDADMCFVSFASKTFWDTHQCIPDTHQYDDLQERFGIEEDYFDEMAENCLMVIPDDSVDDIRTKLESHGLVFSQEMTDFLTHLEGDYEDE